MDMLGKAVFCSDLSRQAAEELPGTAGPRQAWILIQDHAPWGVDAFDACSLPQHLKTWLRSLFHEQKPVILLVRNSDQKNPLRRKLFVVRSPEEGGSIREFEWTTAEDIAELPLARAMAGEEEGIARSALYLVCTHGKRDKCCAKYGLPVYQRLKVRYGDQVWRVSHVGGDRFAGNLVCLPHGIYYGRLNPDEAEKLADFYTQGRISTSHLRGRCCFSGAVQAGEYFIRRRTGLTELQALKFNSQKQLEPGFQRVEFVSSEDGARHIVDIEVRQSERASFLSCRAEQAEPFPCYHLRGYAALN